MVVVAELVPSEPMVLLQLLGLVVLVNTQILRVLLFNEVAVAVVELRMAEPLVLAGLVVAVRQEHLMVEMGILVMH
jgi:hypothetical protein